MASRRRVIGRFVTGLGFAWLVWALFGEFLVFRLGAPGIALPVLPGIVLLFVGRAIGRGARGRSDAADRRDGAAETKGPVATRPDRVVPAPPPRARREITPADPIPEPGMDVVSRTLESPGEGTSEVAGGTTVRKTSAEMIAEARARFGMRP